jgi:hypothetical protein
MNIIRQIKGESELRNNAEFEISLKDKEEGATLKSVNVITTYYFTPTQVQLLSSIIYGVKDIYFYGPGVFEDESFDYNKCMFFKSKSDDNIVISVQKKEVGVVREGLNDYPTLVNSSAVGFDNNELDQIQANIILKNVWISNLCNFPKIGEISRSVDILEKLIPEVLSNQGNYKLDFQKELDEVIKQYDYVVNVSHYYAEYISYDFDLESDISVVFDSLKRLHKLLQTYQNELVAIDEGFEIDVIRVERFVLIYFGFLDIINENDEVKTKSYICIESQLENDRTAYGSLIKNKMLGELYTRDNAVKNIIRNRNIAALIKEDNIQLKKFNSLKGLISHLLEVATYYESIISIFDNPILLKQLEAQIDKIEQYRENIMSSYASAMDILLEHKLLDDTLDVKLFQDFVMKYYKEPEKKTQYARTLNRKYLIKLGLGDLPTEVKDKTLQKLYTEMQNRVGVLLTQGLSEEQLDEFGAFVDLKEESVRNWFKENLPDFEQEKEYQDLKNNAPENATEIAIMSEYGATKWLQMNRPDYLDIVNQIMNELDQELIDNKDALLKNKAKSEE